MGSPATGAWVGAGVGFLARGAVVLIHAPDLASSIPIVALPSAAIGALVGGIAGSTGRPLRGALVGAVLSGVVFQAFMLTCASMIGQFSPQGGRGFWVESLRYGLEMAVAGGIAGLIGGATGSGQADTPGGSKPGEGPDPGAGR